MIDNRVEISFLDLMESILKTLTATQAELADFPDDDLDQSKTTPATTISTNQNILYSHKFHPALNSTFNFISQRTQNLNRDQKFSTTSF